MLNVWSYRDGVGGWRELVGSVFFQRVRCRHNSVNGLLLHSRDSMVRIWNSLPERGIEAETLITFKKYLDEQLEMHSTQGYKSKWD